MTRAPVRALLLVTNVTLSDLTQCYTYEQSCHSKHSLHELSPVALSLKRKGTEIVRLVLHLASYEESLSHLDDSPVSRIVTFSSINVNVYDVQSLTHR